jgi:methyl-accepting chemotaxis protein
VELARLVAQFHTGQEQQAGRPELAVPGRQAPGRNPVAQARARISAFAGGAAAKEWEEF